MTDLSRLPLEELPLELARLHLGAAVEAKVTVQVSCAPPDIPPLFSAAGFGTRGRARARGADGATSVSATRLRTIADVVGPGMRLLMCGLNPSLYSADAGVNFARPGNRFWPAALAAGVVSRPRDPWHALAEHGVGFSDLVKRPTVGASELSTEEYRTGAERLAWTVRLLRPAVVCFVGLTGYRAALDRAAVAGVQPGGFAGSAAYLMPNPSGLNAHVKVGDLAAHFRAAAGLD